MIRINRVGFGFQTLLALQFSVFFSTVFWPCLGDQPLLGACCQLLSVSERVGGPPSPFPFFLTSLLAPLIPSVSVYKLYTFWQPVWRERRVWGQRNFFFLLFYLPEPHFSASRERPFKGLKIITRDFQWVLSNWAWTDPESDRAVWFPSQHLIEMGKVDRDSTHSYLFMFGPLLFCMAQRWINTL